MTEFLVFYAMATREHILQNRSNVAEKLGFLSRIIHGLKPQPWLKELKLCLGEVVDYAEASEGGSPLHPARHFRAGRLADAGHHPKSSHETGVCRKKKLCRRTNVRHQAAQRFM
jgi:hypothetical protein